MNLEDHYGDVIGKARRSAGVSLEEAARVAGLSAEELGAIEEAGSVSKAPDYNALGALLGLHAAKLREVAEGWRPEEPDLACWKRIRQVTTPGASFTVNAYVAWDPVTREAGLFDTGFDAEPIFALVNEQRLRPAHLFITHSHHDHIEAIGPIRRGFPEIQLHSSSTAAPPDQRNQPEKSIGVGRLLVENRATPGHAGDGVTYVIRGFPDDAAPVAVVGDAIFAGSIGGARELAELAKHAIREQIFTLPGATLICPGHGPVTTVAQELAHNPFFV